MILQASSQSEHREAVAKTAEQTAARLEELNANLSHSNSHHSETLSLLSKVRETLAGITSGAWFEQGIESAAVSKRQDLAEIGNALRHVTAQLHNLSGDEASSLTLADLMAQLSDLGSRLTSLEVDVQGAATAAVVVEEISTVKEALSLEHQAGVAAGERMGEAILGLDEFMKAQIDQVNAVSISPFPCRLARNWPASPSHH